MGQGQEPMVEFCTDTKQAGYSTWSPAVECIPLPLAGICFVEGILTVILTRQTTVIHLADLSTYLVSGFILSSREREGHEERSWSTGIRAWGDKAGMVTLGIRSPMCLESQPQGSQC